MIIIAVILSAALKEEFFAMKQISTIPISNYDVKQLLGCGDYGAVYLCAINMNGFEKDIAVKVIFNDSKSTSSVLSKYGQEFVILSQLPFHMNVVAMWHNFPNRPTEKMIDLLPTNKKELVQQYNKK